MGRGYLVVSFLLFLTLVLPASSVATTRSGLVGSHGNEPLIRVAPDGTIYVAALQHLYRSTDGGTTWTEISPAPYATVGNIASDSSIDVASDGSLAMGFDWPYAGQTAVCESVDRGDDWRCDPVAVPGVTDRMWVHFLQDGRLIFVTGMGIEAATMVYVQAAPNTPAYLPGAIQPVALLGSQAGDFAQGWGPTRHDDALLLPVSANPTSVFGISPQGEYQGAQSVPFSATAIPTLARDGAGHLLGTNESGHSLSLVRYEGSLGTLTWSEVPIVSGGNITFSAIAAGPNGTATIIYYWAPNGDDVWQAYAATTQDSQDPTPSFVIQQLSQGTVHVGPICSTSLCLGSSRFAGDFLSATYDGAGEPWWSWMEENADGSTTIHAATTSSPTPGPIPWTQSRNYTLLDANTQCVPACTTFQVPPGATRVELGIRDTASPHVGASYCFDACTGPDTGTLCDGHLLTVPLGAQTLRVMLDPPPVGPFACPVDAPATGTQGTMTADFWH